MWYSPRGGTASYPFLYEILHLADRRPGEKWSEDISTLFSVRVAYEADCCHIHVEGAVEQVVLVPLVPVIVYVAVRSRIGEVKLEEGKLGVIRIELT